MDAGEAASEPLLSRVVRFMHVDESAAGLDRLVAS